MKPTPEERANLLGRLRAALALDEAPTQAELARLTGVTPGQVCHILAGDFVTFGGAVVRICNALGVTPDGSAAGREVAPRPPDAKRVPWSRVERAVRRLWDETPEGADRLVRVLDAIAAVGDRRGAAADEQDRSTVRG